MIFIVKKKSIYIYMYHLGLRHIIILEECLFYSYK